jgi:sugar lactone lactonase YvrE
VAGELGTNGFNGDGLPARRTWLYYPSAISFDAAGRLWVDDFNNMRIRRLDDDGHLRTEAGNGTHAYATPGAPFLDSALENPVDIALDGSDALHIAELHSGRILKLGDPALGIQVVAGDGNVGFAGDDGPAIAASFSEAAGVTVDADGVIYVSDTENHRIRAVGVDGIVRTIAGDGSPGFVDGTPGRLTSPQRLRHHDGALYIADAGNHAVRRLELATGVLSTLAGTGSSGRAEPGDAAVGSPLQEPYGVWPEADGGVLIAESAGHRIVRVTPEGVLEVLAGTGVSGSEGDGEDALTAELSFPVDVRRGPDGAVWIADLRNGAVRRIVPEEAP